MMEDVKQALSELGLAPKESDTYLAMLELGPSSVQDIAKKAGINRTTTYVMLEGLKKHGLVSTFERGKKTMFAAENPQQLVEILTRQMSAIQTKKSKLEESLPRLLAIFNTVEDKPRVRFLEGEEPLRELMQSIGRVETEVWEMYAVDEYLLEAIKKFQTNESRANLPRRLKGRALITVKPGYQLPHFDTRNVEVRALDWSVHQFTGDIAIHDDQAYIFVYKGKFAAIAIQSKEIVEILRALYEMAWSCAVAWSPPENWEKEHRLNK
ncbi:MAG TPA: helix-turn-helix domain-containing protein [Verrucomicrobiae bacterium]|nr:helix-turn-helix domain-containing protein [Verrucomicrobiae bacterium]